MLEVISGLYWRLHLLPNTVTGERKRKLISTNKRKTINITCQTTHAHLQIININLPKNILEIGKIKGEKSWQTLTHFVNYQHKYQMLCKSEKEKLHLQGQVHLSLHQPTIQSVQAPAALYCVILTNHQPEQSHSYTDHLQFCITISPSSPFPIHTIHTFILAPRSPSVLLFLQKTTHHPLAISQHVIIFWPTHSLQELAAFFWSSKVVNVCACK